MLCRATILHRKTMLHRTPMLHRTGKSGSTLVGGPVKSRQKRTKNKGRGLDKELVQLELVTAWIQQLRTTSIDPLHRFRSRGWRWKQRQRQRQTEIGVVTMVDFRLRSTG